MTKLNFDDIWKQANTLYANEKLDKANVSKSSRPYMAPELIPVIASDQVKMMAKALVDAINETISE